MDGKKTLEEIFTKNGIKWEIKDFGSYIDPKCKTAESIYSKLTRLYSAANNKTKFTVLNSGISDLLRITIIVEYSEVISTIQKLKQKFPDLTSYLKSENSGYHGIHLKLKVDGITCEIQLAPKIVVMACDYLHTLYEKWRDFDFPRELELLTQRRQEILNNNNCTAADKNKLLKALDEEIIVLQVKEQEEKEDYKLRRKTYSEIYEAAKLPIYQNEIMKAINELNEHRENSLPLTNPDLINILNKNLLTDGKLDKDKVKQAAYQLSNSIGSTQDKFVRLVKDCLQL